MLQSGSMRRLLTIGLKLLPALAGAAWVCQRFEQKQQRRFSFKRVLLWAVTVVALAVVVSAVYVKSHYTEQYTGEELKGCVVVFGAAVWRDDIPSQALDDRMQSGIELYKRGINCLVLSGGESTYGAHEVDVMRRLAREAGVPNRHLVLDYHGDNTLATMLNLDPAVTHVLVSNDFHLARIGLMAQRLDFTNYYLHAANYQVGTYHKRTKYFWREVFGSLLIWLGL